MAQISFVCTLLSLCVFIVFVTSEILVIQVSRLQQDQTSVEQELELANDHVSQLEAQHQEAIDKTTELEEKVWITQYST